MVLAWIVPRARREFKEGGRQVRTEKEYILCLGTGTGMGREAEVRSRSKADWELFLGTEKAQCKGSKRCELLCGPDTAAAAANTTQEMGARQKGLAMCSPPTGKQSEA